MHSAWYDSSEKSPKPHAKAQSSKEFLRCCSRLLNVRRKNLEILLCDLAACPCPQPTGLRWAAGVREIVVLSVGSWYALGIVHYALSSHWRNGLYWLASHSPIGTGGGGKGRGCFTPGDRLR